MSKIVAKIFWPAFPYNIRYPALERTDQIQVLFTKSSHFQILLIYTSSNRSTHYGLISPNDATQFNPLNFIEFNHQDDRSLQSAIIHRPSRSSNLTCAQYKNRRRELAIYRIGRLRALNKLIDQAAEHTTKLLLSTSESAKAHVQNLRQELWSLSVKMVVYSK